MGEVIVITSGKGGVGKTTTTANVGTGLAMLGKKVVLIDTDIGLRNLDVVMGLENRIVFDIVDVIEGRCTYQKATIRDKRFAGAVTQDPVSIGYNAVKLAYEAANGKEVKDVDTGAKWYNADNMEDADIKPCLYE